MDIVTGCEQPFRGREARVIGDGGPARQRDPRIGASGDLGFGRIVVSKAEAPNLFVNMVESGSTVLQSDDAIEPGADHGVGLGEAEADRLLSDHSLRPVLHGAACQLRPSHGPL